MNEQLGKLILAAMVCAMTTNAAGADRSSVLFVVVRNLPPSEVTSRVQASCLQKGMAVDQATETQVTCSKPMDSSLRSTLLRALATPAYSTNPVYKYRVNAIRVGDQTTVSAEEYVQYQNAYGQMTTIPITNKKELASIQAGLETMKSNWESKLATESSAQPTASQPSSNEATPPSSDARASQPVPNQVRSIGSESAYANPSGPSARAEFTKLGCRDNFSLVSSSAGRSIFEATCASGKRQLLECYGSGCRPLN